MRNEHGSNRRVALASVVMRVKDENEDMGSLHQRLDTTARRRTSWGSILVRRNEGR